MLFAIENLAYWLFLGMGIALFVLVIFAGGDDDVDTDMDADADLEADSDFSALALLRWLGIGKVPLLLLLATDFSLMGSFGWIQNVIIGNLTGQIPTGFLAAVIFLTSLLLSLFIGSLIARPLGRMFASSSEDSSSARILGRTGTVSSAMITSDRVGQIDVRDANDNLVTITATLPDWAEVTPQWGEKVLVIEYQSDCYRVIAADSTDQANWLTIAKKRKDIS